jgi:hypothetical protein
MAPASNPLRHNEKTTLQEKVVNRDSLTIKDEKQFVKDLSQLT